MTPPIAPPAGTDPYFALFQELVPQDRLDTYDTGHTGIVSSSLSLVHRPELVAHFPPQANQHGPSHWPTLRFVVAHELSSGAASRPEWGAMSGPDAVSETALSRPLLRRLPGPAVIVGDRNFG